MWRSTSASQHPGIALTKGDRLPRCSADTDTRPPGPTNFISEGIVSWNINGLAAYNT